MKNALVASTVFFLALFVLGFGLGAIRMVVIVPYLGQLAATFVEVPVMLTAGFFACRRVVRHWQVPPAAAIRWAMTGWFLALLFGFETLLGSALFGRSLADQAALLATPAGMVGLAAQVLAALLPVFDARLRQS